ncbi:Farnesyl diphosphate synthase [Bosea sp. 62]|nr:Farnesyl diphosphate synthase [Bosea sp. 7B]CAD5279681.1 Farnesyl diphosphate synthase [Bosea sp. 21B]CAD5280809.1 Farnesyl diphosphate synthase [Bosea sp. 46]VVT59512.1 Farnesyl diphosphate synthase [Bosea sp. EC-HK365B]VXB31961.1 Farnesyl diphosphate synthase [Bosea sp. 62]VXB94147.1 Farnesyl diphosphate synthase [Bosea sp. 127]VXC34852.1 Farnesyl diphosphate synthase [Bosea sp. 29B]VXC80793.1 Farnesyl diphosphate synthase [Bosea sp. 125]
MMSSAEPTAPAPALTSALSETAEAIEALLDTLLQEKSENGEIHRPARLLAAMRHGALGGGKRLRPFLVVETAKLFGVPAEQALRAGAAVELAHCYSLVHDDLPAMDDDDTRRGRPTVHKAYDEATAILAGDGLLTLAFDVIADPRTHPDGETRAAIILLFARALGLGGMVGGQMLDLAAEGRFGGDDTAEKLGQAEIRRMQAMKTGALLAGSVLIGARLGQADPTRMAALERYGKALGAAFQVADDILDIEASPEQMGKATAKDDAKGKATLVAALGIDAAKRERDRLSDEAIAAIAGFGPEAALLRAAAQFSAQRKS